MIAVQFDAQVTNGTIEIPEVHRGQLQGAVRVIVLPQSPSAASTKIDDLLAHPLNLPSFQPLTREQSHERR